MSYRERKLVEIADQLSDEDLERLIDLKREAPVIVVFQVCFNSHIMFRLPDEITHLNDLKEYIQSRGGPWVNCLYKNEIGKALAGSTFLYDLRNDDNLIELFVYPPMIIN